MKYTTIEICELFNISQSTIWSWINEGIVSHHNNRTGKVIKLKAELVSGEKIGGRYYLIEASELKRFMKCIFEESYLYKAAIMYGWIKH